MLPSHKQEWQVTLVHSRQLAVWNSVVLITAVGRREEGAHKLAATCGIAWWLRGSSFTLRLAQWMAEWHRVQGHSSVQPPGFRDTKLLLLEVLALLPYLCVCPSVHGGGITSGVVCSIVINHFFLCQFSAGVSYWWCSLCRWVYYSVNAKKGMAKRRWEQLIQQQYGVFLLEVIVQHCASSESCLLSG